MDYHLNFGLFSIRRVANSISYFMVFVRYNANFCKFG